MFSPLQSNLGRFWTKTDFRLNKAIWQHYGLEKSLPIRKKNLADITQILENDNIPSWLFGKTLLGIFKNGELIENDHDDDIGVLNDHREYFEKHVIDKLRNAGFNVIRANDHMTSFVRQDRYVDVCFFKKRGSLLGYGNKWYPKDHFERLNKVRCFDCEFNVPNDTGLLLERIYDISQPKQNHNILYGKAKKLQSKLSPKKFYSIYKRIVFRFACIIGYWGGIPYIKCALLYCQLQNNKIKRAGISEYDD